jgi:DNA-binding GntR family transcriptional regulator
LADVAAAYVRERITSGVLTAGDAVRPETIAQELQISTTPAREALQSLRSEGFLELAPRRGFRVTKVTGDDIRDLFFINSVAAGELAARATIKGSESLVERLESIQEKLLQAAERHDPVELELLNHRFHREINLAADSSKLADVIQLVSRWVPPHFYTSIEGWSATTVHDHRQLINAIALRDSERARQLMEGHMRRSGEQLAEYVDERQRAAD